MLLGLSTVMLYFDLNKRSENEKKKWSGFDSRPMQFFFIFLHFSDLGFSVGQWWRADVFPVQRKKYRTNIQCEEECEARAP